MLKEKRPQNWWKQVLENIAWDCKRLTSFSSRIIEALGINTTLTELELGLLTDESLAYLAEFLGKNSSVKNIGFEEGKNELEEESKVVNRPKQSLEREYCE